MKNGCNKKIIYSCDARRFDQEHCFFYEHADLDHCRHKYGGRCISSEAQKHADGRGSKYPKPTEPCHQRYEFPDGTRGMMEILSNSEGELFAFDLDHYPFGRPIEALDGTWGPRAPEWEPDE